LPPCVEYKIAVSHEAKRHGKNEEKIAFFSQYFIASFFNPDGIRI